MNTNLKALATLLLASTVAVGYAQSTASSTDSTPHKATARKTHRKPVEKKPTVESQIEELRQELQSQHGQIDSLKQQLTDRDTQLQQAQQAAQAAQQAAQQAQQAANQDQQQLTDNATAVSSLQSSVSDLKTNTASIVGTIQDQQTQVKKAIENPDALHYKGITLSPAGSFIEAATVYRSAATGGDINTSFTGIPLQNSDAAQLSEFFGSGRQSRLALKATGKLDNMTLTGYYEMDWLGSGITSNNNQSNSYVVRQRQLWAQAALNSGWTFTGGQMWSLATETTHGLDNGTEILPSTIDPQYEAGFVWARQYGFRVSKDFGNKFWIGASAENAETLNPGGSGLPTNVLLGAGGTNGGLYNSTANYSYNLAPDMIAKVAFEPGWGHYELFGIARFFRDRIYPNETTTTVNGTTTASGSSAGAYNDSTVGGGVGGSFRGSLLQKKLTLGLKGLYGDGTGRYGSSTISDITFHPDGQISPLHNFSALSTVEVNPTSRLTVYFNYGGDYVGRDIHGKTGYGLYTTNMSGCNTEPITGIATTNSGQGFTPSTPSNCGGNNKDVQEFTAGYWYNFYSGPMGRLRQGIQYSYFERNLWSGTGGPLNPDGGAKGTDNVFETSFRYYLPQ
jgi:TolA-binding protein